jgi:hypothetical protein
MHRHTLGLAVAAAGLLSLPLQGADIDRLAAVDVRYYNAVKPTADETRWKQIPWVIDLAGAVQTAKKENRPLFLFVSGDDPLERC